MLVSRSNANYHTTFQYNFAPPSQFLREKIRLRKKQLGEKLMLIEQIIEFKLKEPGPLAVHALL